MATRCTVAERNIGIGVALLCIAGLYVIAARDASTTASLHEHSATTATAVRGGGSPQVLDPGRRRRIVSGQVLCWPLDGGDADGSEAEADADPAGVPLTRETLVDALWPRAPVIEADALKTEGFGPQQLHWKTKREATSTAAAYPLTLEQFERSFLPPGNILNWQRMLDALDDGRRLRLVVLGGSMTHGIGCARDALAPICAWHNELRAWLAAVRPHWKLEVVGQGFGGQHAGDLARSTAVQPADIYVVDTLVNSIQVHPVDVPGVYDALMWRLLHHTEAPNMGGPPAVLSVQSMPFPDRLATADSEASVAQHYGLPVASYRLAVFPGLAASPLPPGYVEYLWVDASIGAEKRARGEVYGTHPTKIAHELLSDVVKYAFLRLMSNRTHETTPTGEQCTAVYAGKPPATGMSTVGGSCAWQKGGPLVALSPGGATAAAADEQSGPASFKPSAVDAGWRFYADVPRKPGWIAGGDKTPTTGSSASPAAAASGIEFAVRFSPAAPRLELSFLQSYSKMGAARLILTVGTCKWSYVVNATIDERFSVTQTAILSGPSGRLLAGGAPVAAVDAPLALVDAAESRGRALLAPFLNLGPFPSCTGTRAYTGTNMEGTCSDSCTVTAAGTYTLRVESPAPGATGKFKLLGVLTC